MKSFAFFLSTWALLLIGQHVHAQVPACEDVLQERLDCYDTDGPCELLPIPASAFGAQPDPAKGYMIETLRDGVYAIGEGSYWMMAAIAAQKKKTDIFDIAVFDFPEGSFVLRNETGQVIGSLITNALDELVFDVYNLTIDQIDQVTMVYSHQHMDHIGAASIVYEYIMDNWMPEEVEIVGHVEVEEEFVERTEAGFYSFRAPVPTLTIQDEPEVVKVGADLEFTLTPVTGHTADKDLVIFLERDETGAPAVMMYVDVIFPGWAPFFSFAITTDIFKYIESHQVLLEEFDLGDNGIFIGGHLSKLGSREDIEMSYEFAQSVMAGALLGLQTVDINPIVANAGIADPTSRNLGNSWLLFDAYFKEVVKVCAKQVVAEWGCKLGAVDVVVDSHCRSAQSYWRVDF